MFSCKSKTNEKTATKELIYKAPKITGAKFFDYDELIYYKSEIEENKLRKVDENKHKSELDWLKYNVILRDMPKSINDTAFINKLEKLGYSKIEVGKNYGILARTCKITV